MAQGADRDSAPHILRSQPDNCCGSSVAEHSLGKGEVESSILSRSTIKILSRAQGVLQSSQRG